MSSLGQKNMSAKGGGEPLPAKKCKFLFKGVKKLGILEDLSLIIISF